MSDPDFDLEFDGESIAGKWRDRSRTWICTEHQLIVRTNDTTLAPGTTERIPYADVQDISVRGPWWSPLVQYGFLMAAVALGFAVAVPVLDADSSRTVLSTLVSFPIVPMLGGGGVAMAALGVRQDPVYVLTTTCRDGTRESYHVTPSEMANAEQFLQTVRART
jgi:hypothetical protein